jgi:PAS domain S-box-containing protein
VVTPLAAAPLFTSDERATERSGRRIAEDALRRSEEQSQRLLENISDIVAVIDQSLVFRYVSPSVTRVTAHMPDDLVGCSCLDVMHPDDAVLIRRAMEESESRPAGRPSQRIRLQHVDRSWRVLDVTSARLVKDREVDAFEGLVLTARDVTEQDRLEDQLRQTQKMESIGQLAGGVAHDFNNLLTVILGFSEMLIDDCEPNSATCEDLRAISKAAQHGASLTRQLLAFSRRQILAPKILDLGELSRQLESILRRLIGEDIDTVVTSDSALGLVTADRGQIEQIIMNLAVNARDAMPSGGKLTIEARNVVLDDEYVARHPHATTGRFVMLAVSDTGTGMDAAVQARLFEPFFTTKEPGKGTGLGLATVYGIVKQSEGYIDVYSEVGHGTTFKLYFPASGAAATDFDAAVSPVTSPVPRQATILLVEDDAALRQLLTRSLERSGFLVLAPADIAEALQLAGDMRVSLDMLVTDAIMPKMSGPELAKNVLTQRPALPVLFMSGYTDHAMLRLGLLKTNQAFLQKPFGPRAFTQKVQEVLSTRLTPPDAA